MPASVQTGMVFINGGSAVTITDIDLDFEDANVTSNDIIGSNGVIHAMNGILVPVDL